MPGPVFEVAIFEAACARVRRDVEIWYLGGDYERLQTLRDEFADAKFADVSRAMQEAADALAPMMLDLETALARPDLDRDAWDASDLADRSRHNSPFFLELCRCFAILTAGRSGKRVLAVCDEPTFALALFDLAALNGLSPILHGGSIMGLRLRQAVFGQLDAARSALAGARAAWRRLAALKYARRTVSQPPQASRDVDVWITIWAFEKSFKPGEPLVRDERFGKLPELLRKEGLRLGYIVMPLQPEGYAALAQSAVRCTEPVLFAEDGYHFGDVICAIWQTIRPLAGIRRKLVYRNMDLTPLLQRALAREKSSGRSAQVRLLGKLPRRLAAIGASPKSILFTYEHHSWEKLLVVAARRHLPATRNVGYNHSVFPRLYLGFHPTPGDIASNHIPDRLIVMGEAEAEVMVSKGFPAGRVVNGGALRYSDFFAQVDKVAPAPKKRSVLCCLGVDPDEVIELSAKSADAVSQTSDFSLTINFHPMCGLEFREHVKQQLARNRDISCIRFDDRPVRDLLPESDVVLYNDTNAAFEAVASGRQIIYVGRDTGLNYDKVPSEISKRCTTPQEIARALEEAEPIKAEVARDVLHRYFGPVRIEVFVSALTQ